MTKWTCSKCPFGHNSEVVMIRHQITEHRAVYSEERLKQVGYFKYMKRLKTEGKLKTKLVKSDKHSYKRVVSKK